ncbi:glycosyltransferase [Chloroflexota bacterium]
MKLAVIGPVYPYRGGISHYTSMLSYSLMDSDHDTHVISFQRQYPAWLYPGKSDKDPSQVGLRLEAKYTLDPIYPWTWFNTAKNIKEINPDGVIIQWWTTFWAPAYWVLIRRLKKFGLKTVFVIHNVIPHEALPWDKWIAYNVLRLGDAHLVQAANEEDRLLSLIPDAHPTLCPMPVFNLFPVENSITNNEAKEILGVRTDIPLLLFFGIVRPYKGLKYAIEVVSILKNNGVKVQLIVAGEFWDEIAAYEDQISHLRLNDQVTLVNKYIPDEEVGSYFTAADVFVAPYIDGTQSASVKTALSFNLPIVVTQCVADEILRNNELTRVVPNGDSEALADAINELISLNLPDIKSNYQDDESWKKQVLAIENLVRQAQPGSYQQVLK